MRDQLNMSRGALTRWKRCWKHTPESVLDPRNLDATISFQSISLLMTAYLRLGRKSLPPFYHLTMPFDPRQFASLLIPPGSGGQISDWHINALVHSAHTLMVLVKAGVDYQRRVLSYHWDPHHFMPWIEGAVSLAHWLLIHAELRPESRLARKIPPTKKSAVADTEYRRNRILHYPLDALYHDRGISLS